MNTDETRIRTKQLLDPSFTRISFVTHFLFRLVTSCLRSWFLNGVYLAVLIFVSPVLIFRRLTKGKYRRGWREKLTGAIARQYPDRMCLWFHAVSVGEVLQLQKLLEETGTQFPDAELVLTVTTETGFDVAKSKYPKYTVTYFPLDFSWAVTRALDSIKPQVIVLVELELWPNFIFSARQRKIPLILINGRMGAKSFRGYSWIKPLMQRLLGCFEVLAVQNETYAERLMALDGPKDRIVVTGNIKFDRVESNRDNSKSSEIRQGFKIDRQDLTFIAGSTQDPEESYAIDAWLALRSQFPRLNLILVPRHKERFDEVAELIRKRDCRPCRRSELKDTSALHRPATDSGDLPEVALLDSLGELAACWGLADIAFVGGSLTNRGGQNMIEPAGYGAAVLFGPNTWNFKDVVESLLSKDAAKVVHDPHQLRETVRNLLNNPSERQRMGEAAQAFVVSQQGATRRTVDLIAKVVCKTSTESESTELVTKNPLAKPARIWKTLKLILFIVVMIFVGRRAYELWISAPPASIRINVWWLILAGACYFIGWLPSVWLWKSLLHGTNQSLSWWDAFRAYYVAHVGKYVPGKALVLVIRASLTKRAGVNPVLSGLTAAFETLIYMAAGINLAIAVSPWVVGSDSLFQWRGIGDAMRGYELLVPIVATLLTFASTLVSSWICRQVCQKTVQSESAIEENHPKITASLVSLGVVATSVGWIFHAISLGCVIRSVTQGPFEINQLPMWLFAAACSTVGGFLALFAPGGLGVREGLLVEILNHQQDLGPGVVVMIAGLLRLVWFATELVAAAIFFAIGPKSSSDRVDQ